MLPRTPNESWSKLMDTEVSLSISQKKGGRGWDRLGFALGLVGDSWNFVGGPVVCRRVGRSSRGSFVEALSQCGDLALEIEIFLQ